MTCPTIPRSTLLANYQALAAEFTQGLNLMVVGPDYAYRETQFVANYVATGVAATNWPGLLVTESIDLSINPPLLTIEDAIVQLFTETGGGATSANGVMVVGQTTKIRHNSGTTQFAGSGRLGGIIADVVIGDYVRLVSGANTLETRVVAIETGANPNNTLVLADTLPVALQSGNFYITLGEVTTLTPSIAAPITVSSTQITLGAGLTSTTSRVGSAQPVLGGTLTTNTSFKFSRVYTSYRAFSPATSLSVGNVSTSAEVNSSFIGSSSPKAELGFALQRSIAPSSTSTVPKVYYCKLVTNDASGYQNALNFIARNGDFGKLVVLSNDTVVHGYVKTFIEGRNVDTKALQTQSYLSYSWPVETLLTSGTASATSSVVTATTGIFASAVVGDQILAGSTRYTISVKTSSTIVTVSQSGVNFSSTAVSVYKQLSQSEEITAFAAYVAGFNNPAINFTVPTDPKWNGITVPGYLLTSAIAGMRAYSAPHQSLVRAELEAGWTAGAQTQSELGNDFDTITGSGAIVLDIADSGGLYIYGAMSSNAGGSYSAKEAYVSNSQAVSRYLSTAASCKIGVVKVNDSALTLLRSIITTSAGKLVTNTRVNDLGTFASSITIGVPVINSTLRDKIDIPITATIDPYLGSVELTITTQVG
jgi:hypothetical protein